MVATIGSIQAKFEADLRSYIAGLQRGERATGQFSGRVGKHVIDTQRRMLGLNRAAALTGTAARSAFMGIAAGATAALAPILSVAGAIEGARRALAEFDRIGKQAKAAGLDVEFWQELEHAARLGGVGVDQLSQALNAFTRNAGMAAIGKGELVEKLKQLHPELLRNILAAGSMEQRVRILADALATETDASRKAAIAAAAFGDSGVKMVEMLKGGAAGLDNMAREARRLGLVIDRELIAKSETLNDQLSIASRAIDLNLKQALLNIAPVLISSARLVAAMTGDLRRFIDTLKELENRSSASLDERMRAIGADRLRIENEILALQERQRQATGVLAEAERRLLEGTISKKRDELAAIAAEEERILGILDNRKPAEPTTAPAQVDWGKVDIEGSAASRNRAAEAAIKEAEAVRDLIEQLTIERNELHLSDEQKRINAALRQAGAAATAEEREAIRSLITEIEAEKAAVEASKEAHDARIQAVEFGMSSVFQALEGIADGSMTAEEALKAMIVQLAKALAMAALLGQGPLAGLFGGGGLLGGLVGGGTTKFAGGILSGSIVGLFHDGGDAGNPRRFRAVSGVNPPTLPKYHSGRSGVGHNEVMALLEKSESVFTAGQTGRIAEALAINTEKVKEHGSGESRSSVEIRLSPELVGRILEESGNQAVNLIRSNEKFRARYYRSGGEPR